MAELRGCQASGGDAQVMPPLIGRCLYLASDWSICSLVTRQPLPVNSLDVVGGSLVFGGDTEAFYVLHNVIA